MTDHVIPVSQSQCIESFTFVRHVEYAKDNDLCWDVTKSCPQDNWYIGGSDWAPTVAFREIDIPVHPSAPMKIVYAGWDKKANPTYGFGVYVKGDCGDGDVVTFGHLQDGTLGFEVGQTVDLADVLGLMGWTGNVRPQGSLGKHVHWGIKRNGIPIDPMTVLGAPAQPPLQPPVLVDYPGAIPLSGLEFSLLPDLDYLNVRSSPEVLPTNDIGDLHQSDSPLKAIRVWGPSLWIEFETGKWAAIHHGRQYLAPKGGSV